MIKWYQEQGVPECKEYQEVLAVPKGDYHRTSTTMEGNHQEMET